MCAENEAVTVTFTIEVETTTATGSLMEAIVEAEEADVDEGDSHTRASRRLWREKN